MLTHNNVVVILGAARSRYRSPTTVSWLPQQSVHFGWASRYPTMFGYLGHANNVYNNAMYVCIAICFVCAFPVLATMSYNWQRGHWIIFLLMSWYHSFSQQAWRCISVERFFDLPLRTRTKVIITRVRVNNSHKFWRACVIKRWLQFLRNWQERRFDCCCFFYNNNFLLEAASRLWERIDATENQNRESLIIDIYSRIGNSAALWHPRTLAFNAWFIGYIDLFKFTLVHGSLHPRSRMETRTPLIFHYKFTTPFWHRLQERSISFATYKTEADCAIRHSTFAATVVCKTQSVIITTAIFTWWTYSNSRKDGAGFCI